MIIQTGGKFIKASEVTRGSIIKILDGGTVSLSEKFSYPDGMPLKEFLFTVELEGEEKQLRMNGTSRKALAQAFGKESRAWIGKKAVVHVLPSPSGKDMIILDPIKEDKRSNLNELPENI